MLKEIYKRLFLSVVSMIGSTCTTVKSAGHFNSGKLGIETRASSNRLFAGNCTVEDSKMGHLKGAGFCQVKRSSLKSISVAGATILFEVLVQDTAKVAGWLKAERSRFNSAIRVCSDRVELVDCNAKEIAFTAKNSSERVEKLFLKKTHVEGNVTFENGRGQVILDSESAISGNIVGGVQKIATSVQSRETTCDGA